MIAVQDGEITAVGESQALGRYVSLRDAYGNTYTYAQLGSVAPRSTRCSNRAWTRRSARGSPIRAAAAPVGPPQRARERRRAAPLAPLAGRGHHRPGDGGGQRSWKRPPRRSRPRHLRCSRLPRQAGRPRCRTPSAPAPTRSTSTRCAPGYRCWLAPCSGTSARPARGRRDAVPHDGAILGRDSIHRRGAGRGGADGGAHALPDPPRGRRRAADRPQADPRRLGAPGRDLGVQGQGREPLPRDLSHRRAGAAGVQAAARAVGAARPRASISRLASAARCAPARSTGACWRRSSSSRSPA